EALFRRLLERAPEVAASLWMTRGAIHARQGRWAESAADCLQARRLEPLSADSSYSLLLALRSAGDRNDLLPAMRAEFFDRFCNATDDSTVQQVVIWSTLDRAEGGPLEPGLRLAEQEIARRSSSPRKADSLQILGALLYRAGRFEEALTRLEEAVRERGG